MSTWSVLSRRSEVSRSEARDSGSFAPDLVAMVTRSRMPSKAMPTFSSESE